MSECKCGKPTSGATMCGDCETTFRYAIANIGAYWTELGTVARKQTRFGTGGATKGSIGKSQPLPVDMRFMSVADDDRGGASVAPGTQLRWDTWNTIVAWCRTVMEDQPEVFGATCDGACLHVSCAAIRRRKWPRNNVPSMVNYLARQFRWIVLEQWAPDMFDEFLDLERRLTRMVDRPADKWYAGRCSVADESENECTAELYARTDRGFIDCPGCGIRHDVGERRAILLAESADILVTATEAAGALLAWTDYDGSEEKMVDRIRKWRSRERLEARGITRIGGKDRDLYRLGDIQALMIDAAQREQARRTRSA